MSARLAQAQGTSATRHRGSIAPGLFSIAAVIVTLAAVTLATIRQYSRVGEVDAVGIAVVEAERRLAAAESRRVELVDALRRELGALYRVESVRRRLESIEMGLDDEERTKVNSTLDEAESAWRALADEVMSIPATDLGSEYAPAGALRMLSVCLDSTERSLRGAIVPDVGRSAVESVVGLRLHELGRPDLALVHLERAVEVDSTSLVGGPERSLVEIALAEILVWAGRDADALEFLENSTELADHVESAWRVAATRARALAATGRTEDAIALVSPWRERSADAALLLVDLLLDAGRSDDAAVELRSIADGAPATLSAEVATRWLLAIQSESSAASELAGALAARVRDSDIDPKLLHESSMLDGLLVAHERARDSGENLDAAFASLLRDALSAAAEPWIRVAVRARIADGLATLAERRGDDDEADFWRTVAVGRTGR